MTQGNTPSEATAEAVASGNSATHDAAKWYRNPEGRSAKDAMRERRIANKETRMIVPGDDLVPFGIFTYIDRAKEGDPCDDGTGCCEWCGKSLSRFQEVVEIPGVGIIEAHDADGCRVCLAWLDWYGANHAR